MQWCQLVPLLRLKEDVCQISGYMSSSTPRKVPHVLSFLDGFDELPDICLASQSVL